MKRTREGAVVSARPNDAAVHTGTHAATSVAQAGWAVWSPAERESFFAAIERHRRATWRVTLASTAANGLMALIIGTLTAPLFYSALILAFDIANLVRPTLNIATPLAAMIDQVVDAPETVSAARWLMLAVLAAAPGLAWMSLVLLALRRMLRVASLFDAADLRTREPNTAVLAEQRFANVVAEMSIAANLPPPRVFIVDGSAMNAAVFGHHEPHGTIVISARLLERLDRAQLQGVAAHLVSSIANGDLAIGMRAALTIAFFGWIAYLGTILVNSRSAGRKLLWILRTTLVPTAESARRLASELADPLVDGDANDRSVSAPAARRDGWGKARIIAWAVLIGPLVLSGFLGGMISGFGLAPLLALIWRQRKYMADASAVRLTRDPDALSGALEKMAAAGAGGVLVPWAAHLSVMQRGSGSRFVGGGVVPSFPSLSRRLMALAKLGAHLKREPERTPMRTRLIAVPLLAVMGVLVLFAAGLLMYLSLAVTMFATGVPVMAVHALLRWLGN